ncbi:hypothetical protein NX059_002609 [Plenodomus lindquistii]|nr:hypothetical protein NX059_002609 [Plenodomus lindquistii]
MATTFSYAQAAKGVAAPPSTTKPISTSTTPVKDAANASVQDANATARSWAEDVETESRPDQPSQPREPRSQSSSSNAARVSRSVDTSSVSSPDLGASSSSTVTKDDDVSSIPNTSSESTWDNKSQASTSVEKAAEPAEKTTEKVKKGKNAIAKPLQEAPPPAVNIWKMRADELKAKVKTSSAPATNGYHASTAMPSKKSDSAAQDKYVADRNRARDDTSSGRKEFRGETEVRKGTKGRGPEKETKAAAGVLPPPPTRDQESWPTPDIAIDEDRKKAQEKGEKPERDRKDGLSSGKHEWVKVPYTPSVVFNTPLPSAANARRGGRPGGRGGAQNGGRLTASLTNGAMHTEKDGSESDSAPSGEQAKRERHDGAAPHDVSPKPKRNGNIASTLNPEAPAVNGEVRNKPVGPVTSEADSQVRGNSESTPFSGHSSSNSRIYAGRPNKARRGDFSGAGERRRDDGGSPTKDNTCEERRPSAATHTDLAGDGERRGPFHHQDGPNGHHSKQGRFASFSGGRGDRGRGGRGTRSSYPNGNQYMNGHQSMQSSSSFSMGPRSPTVFNPENSSFFSQSQGKYNRNAHRSQSMTTTDSYRFPPYQNGSAAPMQGYPVYDYGMMPPMSPLAFNGYGVDQFALFNMITTQVEYYFSIDNLLKDMYLRRHMDSQGFVSLEFIAGFNRIKNLSTDLELIKLVCQQSGDVEYRTSENGQDRLRRRDGWAQWVLKMEERDESARNDGPKELHQPPVPRPAGFEQPVPFHNPYSNEGAFAHTNGPTSVSQDIPVSTSTEGQNGTTELQEGTVTSNERPIEELIKAVSGVTYSFPDAHLGSLTFPSRKQSVPGQSGFPFHECRTLPNGSAYSKLDAYDETGHVGFERSVGDTTRVIGVDAMTTQR